MEVRTALHRVPVWVDGATVDATGQVAVGVGFSDKHILKPHRPLSSIRDEIRRTA